ncbi:MAG: hypothetical protein ABIT58_11330 [Ferruginibacter sp.]
MYIINWVVCTKANLKNNIYSFFADSIVQGKAVARAMPTTHFTSNYHSPPNEFQRPKISSKFSINRKDNEMRAGVNHGLNVLAKDSTGTTAVIKFGTEFKDQTKIPVKTYLAPNTRLTIRLDSVM